MIELTDLQARVARLEEQIAVKETGPATVPPPTAIDAHNSSGLDMELGDWVEISGLGSSGMPSIQRPTADSSEAVLGVLAQRIPTGEAGKVHTHGLVPAYVTGTTSPATGDTVGTTSGTFYATPDQENAGIFYAWIRKASSLAWVLLQRTASPLVTDHRHDLAGGETSTEVREPQSAGPDWIGALHDQWKVVNATSGKKLAHALAWHGKHLEGWAWGNVLDEYGGSGLFGWAPWSDLVGFEAQGSTEMNFWCWGRWNNGSGSVGPILFAEDPFREDESITPVIGRMIFDGTYWRPGLGIETVRRHECTPATPFPAWTGDCDCHCLDSPQDYQLTALTVHGPYRRSDSLDNFVDVICCLVERINLLFRLVHYLDCCYGNFFQTWDDWFNQNLAGVNAGDIVNALNWAITQIQNFHSVSYGTAVATWPGQCDPVATPYNEQHYKDRTSCEDHGV